MENKKEEFLGTSRLLLVIVILIGIVVVLSLESWQEPTSGSVSAQEIYKMFICPCCGKTIDQCTCAMAAERRAFVDGITQSGVSQKAVIAAYAKKYGLDSFENETKKEAFREKLVMEAPAERPRISLSSDFYDFGDVSQKQGKATTFFEINNKGQGDLIINRLETSCGCTSASIVYQEEEGPVFSMPGHGINEEVGDWQVTIPAGQSAQLKIYYDPNVHLDFRGTAIREIYIYSNDPIDFQVKVKVELNQVD